jgi:hypothetical protein
MRNELRPFAFLKRAPSESPRALAHATATQTHQNTEVMARAKSTTGQERPLKRGNS